MDSLLLAFSATDWLTINDQPPCLTCLYSSVTWWSKWLLIWLTDWLTDLLITLIYWLIDCMSEWVREWLISFIDWWIDGWLDGWIYWFMIDWLIDWLIDRSIDRSISWLFNWFTGWLPHWLAVSLTDNASVWMSDNPIAYMSRSNSIEGPLTNCKVNWLASKHFPSSRKSILIDHHLHVFL